VSKGHSTHTTAAADIEAKLREIQSAFSRQLEERQASLRKFALVAAVGLLLLAYLLGRRRGRLRSTVVEVRRI
jgi:hypothetical protein